MINLHIGFVSRCRQSLLLVLQLSKYLPIPDTYRGQYFRFSGPIKEVVEPTNSRASMWQPRGFKNPGARIESDKSENYTLPREKHQQPIYAYGNESLCDSLGYEAGSCLCLNGGGMNHSKLLSKNGGLSKALIMSLTLMVAPEDINTPMCYWECWTPLNMQRVFRRFIPLVNALCEALTHHFWELESRSDNEILTFAAHLGIDRTYMSTFFMDLNNESVIIWEQLTRLLRDTLHFTAIKTQDGRNVTFHPPQFTIGGVLFTSPMEEAYCAESRTKFQKQLVVSFGHGSPESKWNLQMAKIITLLWELCQLININQKFDYADGDLSRIYIRLSDYRLNLETIMYFCTHYAYPTTDRGYTGFRIQPQYCAGPTNILPMNPSRPTDFVLSAAYTHEDMAECRQAMSEAIRADCFPGQHSHWH